MRRSEAVDKKDEQGCYSLTLATPISDLPTSVPGTDNRQAGKSGQAWGPGDFTMGELDIRFYLSLLIRRLPYFLAIVTLLTTGGLVLAYMLPPVYRASGKILVEAPQIPSDMARPTVSTNPVEQFETIQQQVTTQDNLVALAARLNIYAKIDDNLSSADIADDMRSRVMFEQVSTPQGGQGATVFSISFDAKDPALAAKVVNDLLDSIISKNVSLRTGRAGDTLQFFAQEVSRLGSQLTSLEAEILKFKNANKDALPDSLDFRRSQQSSLQDRLGQLEREEAGLRSRRSNLVQMFVSTGRVANAGPVNPDQKMLDDLNLSLSDQLTVFSETSPTVVALRARIKGVQEKLRSSQAGAAGKTGPSELDFQLSDIDERLRFIGQETSVIKKNLAGLAKSIAATPANDATVSSLDRNRANIQLQYNTATALLAQASTGDQIEARSKGGRLSVLEPAVQPEKPISPKRRRIAAAGLAAGAGLGLGLIVLLEMLNKTIRRPTELAALLQSQPLATIPYILTKREKRSKINSLRLGLAKTGSGLIGSVIVAHSYMPVGTVLAKLVAGFSIKGTV